MSAPSTINRSATINRSVSTVIDANADTLYALVADVTRMPEYSPETTKVVWIRGHDRPVVGASFKGTNKLGFLTWSTKPTVTVAEAGRQFAFKVPGGSGPTWTYTFEPLAEGTRVTESVAQTKPSPALIRFLQRRAGVTDRGSNLETNMSTTLANLSVAAKLASAER
jgi:hypothetical protein